MAVNTTLSTAPLTAAEVHHLETIYGTRLRMFGSGFGFMFLFLIYQTFPAFLPQHNVRHTIYDHVFGVAITKTESVRLVAIILACLLLILAFRVYLKRIHPFKKDIRSGEKELAGYIIKSKTHFPLTNQYYFNFDDPDMMHYEVSAEEYGSLNEGEIAYIPRGKYSKQVFEKNGRFTLM